MIDAGSALGGFIVGVMVCLVVSVVLSGYVGKTPQRGAQRLTCDACETTFDSSREAREHAIHDHPAIDHTTWESIITEA